jgi:hypothetical protein
MGDIQRPKTIIPKTWRDETARLKCGNKWKMLKKEGINVWSRFI